MAGLEGIDASSMDVIDALGAKRFVYDAGERIARPLLRHADFTPVAILKDGERVVERVRFGMPVAGGRLITNARDDKLTHSPAWKNLFEKSRGLAAISYVVEREAKTKAAYRIQRRDGGLIVVPALVARRHYKFTSTGNEYDDLGHVQITADSNDFVGTVHDRFVVELATRKERDAWMDPSAAADDLMGLIKAAPNDRYEMVPIAADVWTRRDDPDAAKPRGEAVVWKWKPKGQQRL
jgi:putative SOS response-associated peptidase YedK